MVKKIIMLFVLSVSIIPLAARGNSKADARNVAFFHRWPMEPRFSYFNEIVAKFEREHPDIRIQMDMVENEAYKEKIRVLVSSDDIPDVFPSWSDSFALNLVRSGRIKPLNELLKQDPAFAATIIPSQIQPFTFDNIIYGLPLTIDGKVLVYNKAMWNEAAIGKEPQNFEELLAILNQFQKQGYTVPILEGLANPWAISHYLGTMFQRFLSPEIAAKDYNEATGQFTDPGYGIVIDRFMQLVDFMGPAATSLTHTEVRNQFIAGRLPMAYMQIAEFGYIEAADGAPEYGFFNFPPFSDGKGDPTLLTGAPEGFMMSIAHAQEAERFFKYLFSEDNAYTFVKNTGAPVAIVGAVTPENAFPAMVQAVDMILKSGGSAPWFDNAVNIRVADAFMRGVQSQAAGDMTTSQVIANVRKAAETVRSQAK